MIGRVLEYVASQPVDKAGLLLLEDMALCVAWDEAHADPAEAKKRFPALPRYVEKWTVIRTRMPAATMGRRQQPLLRALIDQIMEEGVKPLKRDEVDFLCAAYDLNSQGITSGRLAQVLGPHHASLETVRQHLTPIPDQSNLFMRLRVTTPEEIEAAARRTVRMFKGDTRAATGPALTLKGPTRVLGNVPENCTLVVRDGSCTVMGYVLGRVVTKLHCEVSENISGAVVAHEGDVRCRNIIDRALVVAKSGSIYFVQGQQPDHVFAGQTIRARERTLRGRYTAPRIRVGHSAQGGEYHVAQEMIAEQYTQSETEPLSIVLRDHVSLHDYGEELDAKAAALVAEAAGLRKQLGHLTRMALATQEEAERSASGALLQVFNGRLVNELIETRERIGRRLVVLNRIMSALFMLFVDAQDNLNMPSAKMGASARPTPPERLLADVHVELSEAEAESGADQDLDAERQEMTAVCEQLATTANDRKLLSATLRELRERMDTWAGERQRLIEALRHTNHEIAVVTGGSPLVSDANPAEPRLALLQRKLRAIRDNPPSPDVARRLESPIVNRMLGDTQRRIRRLAELAKRLKQCHEQLEQVTGVLQSKYKIVPSHMRDAANADDTARVTGRFAAGIQIYNDLFLLEEEDPPPGSIVRTADSGKEIVIYYRGVGRVEQHEEKAGR